MVIPKPKNQEANSLYCPDCNTKIPPEVIENNNDPNTICCPHCGVIIPIAPKVESPEITQEISDQKPQVKILEPFPINTAKWQIKNFLYYTIHDLLYSKLRILNKVEKQEPLGSLTLKRYAKQLRSKLLKKHIPRDLITRLSPRERRKIPRLLHQFKESIKDDKQFKEYQKQDFTEEIQFIFNVMKGDYEFVDFSAMEKEIVMELKNKVNIFKDIRHRGSIGRTISIILAHVVHQRLLALTRTSEDLSSIAVKELVDGLIDQLGSEDNFEWIETQINIKLDRRKRYNLKMIRLRLNTDWIQRECFSDFLVSIVEVVDTLMHNATGEFAVSGLNKIILHGFEKSELFCRDMAFTAREELNLTIVLARMIHAYISASFPPPIEANPNQKLPPALNREINATILEGLVERLEINSVFLLRFYNFSLDKFHNTREKLLQKLECDMIYRTSFRTFLANLIEKVFKITRQKPKGSELSALELRISEDLELYPYDWRNKTINLFENEKSAESIELSDDLYSLPILEEISIEDLELSCQNESDFSSKIPQKSDFLIHNQKTGELGESSDEKEGEKLGFNSDMKNGSSVLTKPEEITKNLILKYIKNNSKHNSFSVNEEEPISHYNLWFFDQIRICLESIPNIHLRKTFKKYLSFSSGMNKLFGLCDNYIGKNRQKSFAKKIIAEDILERMKLNFKRIISELTEKFPQYRNDLEEIEQKICDIFQNYSRRFSPNPSYKYRMNVMNPFFKPHFFSNIDTLEKAYFLGLMFADGWIGEDYRGGSVYYYMGLKFKSEDTLLLLHLCEALGLNPEKISIYVNVNKKTGSRSMVSIVSWGGQKMAEDLISLGMGYIYDLDKGERRKNPVLPQLRSYDLMLAFLLGYFDGDGTICFKRSSLTGVGSPKIYSSSERFLEQVKSYFKIKIDPNPTTTENVYELALPTSLYAEMLKNYSLSLKRKRISLEWTKKESRKEQFFWFKKVFTEDEIRHIYSYISPSSISKLVNISQISLLRYAKELYNLQPNSSNHYRDITWDIKKNGEKSLYFEVVKKIRDFLQKSAFDPELSYKPSPIPKVGLPSFKLYIPSLEFYQWYI